MKCDTTEVFKKDAFISAGERVNIKLTCNIFACVVHKGETGKTYE